MKRNYEWVQQIYRKVQKFATIDRWRRRQCKTAMDDRWSFRNCFFLGWRRKHHIMRAYIRGFYSVVCERAQVIPNNRWYRPVVYYTYLRTKIDSYGSTRYKYWSDDDDDDSVHSIHSIDDWWFIHSFAIRQSQRCNPQEANILNGNNTILNVYKIIILFKRSQPSTQPVALVGSSVATPISSLRVFPNSSLRVNCK